MPDTVPHILMLRLGWVPKKELDAMTKRIAAREDDKEAPAALREMKFCQSLSSHWRCNARDVCTANKRCAHPDHAYKSIEWAEPERARKMGEIAYYAGLDITFDCPFNGSGYHQHAQAYFRLGFLEAWRDHQNEKMSGDEHGSIQEVRAAMRKSLGVERYGITLSGRTLESIEQDRQDYANKQERIRARKPSP